MLSCRAATALMEKKQRAEISFADRQRLRFHLLLCNACRQYERQSAFIEQLFRKKQDALNEEELAQTAAELEEKILRKLDEK